jgi:hypothetical protein
MSNSRVTVSNNNRRVRLPLRASRLNGTSSRRTLRNLATNGRLRNALGFYDGIFVTDDEGNTSDTGIGGVITGLFPSMNWEDWVTNCPLLNIGGNNNGGTDDTTGGDGTAEATGDIVIHFETPAETANTHTKIPYANAATATAARGTPALTAQRATTSATRRRVGTSASSSRVGTTTSYAAAAPASTSVAAANEPARVINLNTGGTTTTAAAAGFSRNLTTGATVGNSSSSNVVVPDFSGRRVTQNMVNRRHSSSSHYSGNGIIYPGNHHSHRGHSGNSGEGYTEVSWEPYTCYEQQMHYEPVTTYETYYTSEPVTKYRKVYTTVEPAYCDDNITTFNDSTVDCGCSGSEWSSRRHHRNHTGYDDGDVWIPEYPRHHRHHNDGTSHRQHSGHCSDDVWIPEHPHRHHGHRHHGHRHSGHSDDVTECPEHHHHHHHGHCDCSCNNDTDNGDIIIDFGSSNKKGFEHLGDLPSGFKEKL